MLNNLSTTKSKFYGKVSILKASAITGSIILLSATPAFAAIDLIAGGKSFFTPVITFINTYFTQAIFCSAALGAVVAQGDVRTRSQGAAIGAVTAALVFTALPPLLGLVPAA